MASYIEEISFLGEPAVRAGNEAAEIILVSGWGSNLISFVEKTNNIELLRVPDSMDAYLSKPYLYGIPILFPPNRIRDGRFTFNDKTYYFQINDHSANANLHGLLYDQKWNLIKAEASEQQVTLVTEFDSALHPSVLKQFPHHFTIQIVYQLEGSTLYKLAIIKNHSNEEFPWGFGYHTAFRYPIEQGSSPEPCTFSLTVDQRWELNERQLPTGNLLDLDYWEKLREGMLLNGLAFDDAYLSSEDSGGKNQAIIRDGNIDLQIVYRCDENFKHWVVYNGDGQQGFVCAEPYTWLTDAPNLDLPQSLTGLQVLAPGEAVTLKCEMRVISGNHHSESNL